MTEPSPILTPAALPLTDALVYEYGVRIDEESCQPLHDELFAAHQLYNSIIAAMHDVVRGIDATYLSAAGDEARALQARIDEFDAAFKAAKAADDEDAMKAVATERRAVRRQLWDALAKVRKEPTVRQRVRPLYDLIGLKKECATYQCRCAAVAAGLGSSTADAVLAQALGAWKKTIARGRAPAFARFNERDRIAVINRFTVAGGVPAADILANRHAAVQVTPPREYRKRRYGDFLFRIGPAKAERYVRGTIQMDRPLPEGASVSTVRLLAKRKADRWVYALQFVLKLPEPVQRRAPDGRRPLVALHVGWAQDISGRRIAGIATGADIGLTDLLRLPPDIEGDLERAAGIQSVRGEARDALMTAFKALPVSVPDGLPEPLAEEWMAIRRLPAQHVAAPRLGRFAAQLVQADEDGVAIGDALPLLREWRREDRKAWQAQQGIARRARLRRRDFYRCLARDLVRDHAAIALEMPDLKKAALKLDEDTGEKSEFNRAARAGRTVAALYELQQAIGWACNRTGTPLIEIEGAETVARCPHCGGPTTQDGEDWHRIVCTDCGGNEDRKLAGAARAWQIASVHLGPVSDEFHAWRQRQREESIAAKSERLQRMQAARVRKRSDIATATAPEPT